MDAKEYLLKVERICRMGNGCDNCPLSNYACGYPMIENEIDELITIVENYKLEESNENNS